MESDSTVTASGARDRAPRFLRLGSWLVELESGVARHPNQSPTRLEPKKVEVLLALARAQGAVVSRGQLLREVWHGEFVTDEAVWSAIHGLRRTLEADPKNPQLILTIPKRGYRLHGELLFEEPAGARPSAIPAELEVRSDPPPTMSAPAGRGRWLRPAALAGLGILIGAGSWVLRPPPARTVEAAMTSRTIQEHGPDSVEGLVAAGIALLRSPEPGDKRAAMGKLRTAVERYPGSAAALVSLANAHLSHYHEQDADPRWLDEAQALADRVSAIDPNRPCLHRLQTAISYYRGKPLEALRHLLRARELDADSPYLPDLFAMLYTELGELDQALLWYLRRPGPAAPRYLANQLKALLGLGAERESRALFRSLQTIGLDKSASYLLAERLLTLDGKAAAAGQLLLEAASKNPQAQLVAIARAEHELVVGNPREATRLLDELPEAVAEQGRARLLFQAIALFRIGEHDRAQKLFTDVEHQALAKIRAGHELSRYWLDLAATACWQGATDRSFDLLGEAVDHGYMEHWWLPLDPRFTCLPRNEPRLEAVLERMRVKASRQRAALDAEKPDWSQAAVVPDPR